MRRNCWKTVLRWDVAKRHHPWLALERSILYCLVEPSFIHFFLKLGQGVKPRPYVANRGPEYRTR